MSDRTSQDGQVKIQRVPPEEMMRGAAVLAETFREEAFNRSLMDLSTPERQQRHARLVEHLLLIRHATGADFYAATKEKRFVGGAVVRPAGAQRKLPWYRLVGLIVRAIPRMLPMLGAVRWRRAMRALPAVRPPRTLPEPHCILEILGVARDHQGQGIGRRLLEHIHARCDEHTDAAGVYLYTGDETNTRIYARFGYELVEAKQGGSLTVWHMFRPRGAVR